MRGEHEGRRHVGHRGREVWNHGRVRDANGRDGFWLGQEGIMTSSRHPKRTHLLKRVGVGGKEEGRDKNIYTHDHAGITICMASSNITTGEHNPIHLTSAVQQVHSFNNQLPCNAKVRTARTLTTQKPLSKYSRFSHSYILKNRFPHFCRIR